ncbi:MAG: sulfotransferase [Gammaproteobacteria bacterium]|nr:sulfotransferase [Gammaproteobacteria bacterium]
MSDGSSYLGHNLVFIISQPKAGSTLLQRILAGHPEVQTSAETWLMLHPVYALRSFGIDTDYNANWAATGVREFLENYAEGEATYREGLRSFAATVYGSVLERSSKRIFLDKTPRYTMIVDDLIELFPAAKFIFLLRNPLAILKSELHTYVKGDWPVLAQFRPDLIDAPARIVSARAKLGDIGHTIHYEDLVSNPETCVESLCTFLNIELDTAMLDYSNTPAPVGKMNDPVGIHRHSSPSTDSLDRWKELGSDRQSRHFALSYLADIGDETISALGYDPAGLRQAINEGKPDSARKTLYPWKLAMTPIGLRSLRQHLQHAWYTGAGSGGPLSGILEVLRLLAGRVFSGGRRLAGGPPTSRGDSAR